MAVAVVEAVEAVVAVAVVAVAVYKHTVVVVAVVDRENYKNDHLNTEH